MSPHPARILVFIVVVLAWLLTARVALADEAVSAAEPNVAFDEDHERGRDAWAIGDWVAFEEPAIGQGDAFVSLSAFSGWSRAGLMRDMGGLVVVGIPLERFALPARPVASLSEALDDRDDEHDAEETVPEPRLTIAPTAARACVQAALRTHGLEHDTLVDSLASRARISAALPDVRLRAARVTDAALRFSPTQYDPYRYTTDEEAGFRLEATLAFRLNRLLFANEEVALERVRLQRMAARQKLATRVLRVLFAWQSAVALQRDPTLPPEKATAAALRALEAETELEVLTAGACTPDVFATSPR